MNENEILEVEIEFGGGNKITMEIQQSDDWSEIKENSRAIIALVNGTMQVVYIIKACDDEGVSFKIPESENRTYHYDAETIYEIYVEVTK